MLVGWCDGVMVDSAHEPGHLCAYCADGGCRRHLHPTTRLPPSCLRGGSFGCRYLLFGYGVYLLDGYGVPAVWPWCMCVGTWLLGDVQPQVWCGAMQPYALCVCMQRYAVFEC